MATVSAVLDTACGATVSSFLSASSADVALESPEEFVISAELLAVDSLTAELSATVTGAELEAVSYTHLTLPTTPYV